jgi:LPS-assembly lipoprotein
MLSSTQKIFYFLCILGATWLLSSCGFHLRGPVELAPPFKRLYIESHDPYSELTRNLQQYFKTSHVYLADSPQAASGIFEIIQESTSQQLLSVGGTQQTRQYNLILSVTFQVTTPQGVVLIAPQTVSESQTLTVQADQILGGSNEQNNLYHQMRRAITYTIMNRLSSRAATESVMGISKQQAVTVKKRSSH